MIRLNTDPVTQDYLARRTTEGKTKRDVVRCLKRHVAREVFRLFLTRPAAVPSGDDLRTARQAAGFSLSQAAKALGSWPTRISELERSLKHDTKLACRYQDWRNAQLAA